MGGTDRDAGVAIKLDQIFDLIESSQFDKAQKRVDTLRTDIGEHPELVEAQALIGRYRKDIDVAR